MPSTKTKQNTNAYQQSKPKANTYKQSSNDNTQTYPSHNNWDIEVNTSNAFTMVKDKIILSSFSKVSSTNVISNTPQIYNHEKTKLFKSTNRFQILSQDVETGPNPKSLPNLDIDNHNVFKPHPLIFVRGVTNYLNLSTALIELISVDNFFYKAFADRLKFLTANPGFL